jgi:hypothetical protein
MGVWWRIFQPSKFTLKNLSGLLQKLLLEITCRNRAEACMKAGGSACT